MENIKILRTGINVNKIKAQLKQYASDWNTQNKIDTADSLLNYGYPKLEAGVLQLVIGGVENLDQFVGDTDICIPTPAYYHHTEMVGFLKRNFGKFDRCGFLSLPVGGYVGTHIDRGKYYFSRDRYHLSIQSTYRYTVGDEFVDVEPGTLLIFNNLLPHGTKNLGDEVRVTFVFDVPKEVSLKKQGFSYK